MSEPLSIREALLSLAADWRERALEAWVCACTLMPFAASHKLAGQADVLDQCAAAVEGAAAGQASPLAGRLGFQPCKEGRLPR